MFYHWFFSIILSGMTQRLGKSSWLWWRSTDSNLPLLKMQLNVWTQKTTCNLVSAERVKHFCNAVPMNTFSFCRYRHEIITCSGKCPGGICFQLWWLIMTTFCIATLFSIGRPGESCLRDSEKSFWLADPGYLVRKMQNELTGPKLSFTRCRRHDDPGKPIESTHTLHYGFCPWRGPQPNKFFFLLFSSHGLFGWHTKFQS